MGCIPLRTKGMVLEMAKAGDRGFIQLRTRAAREVLGREWGGTCSILAPPGGVEV